MFDSLIPFSVILLWLSLYLQSFRKSFINNPSPSCLRPYILTDLRVKRPKSSRIELGISCSYLIMICSKKWCIYCKGKGILQSLPIQNWETVSRILEPSGTHSRTSFIFPKINKSTCTNSPRSMFKNNVIKLFNLRPNKGGSIIHSKLVLRF